MAELNGGLKYTIVVNQLVLSQYPELDIIDGAILDYLQDICSSTHPAIVSKRKQDDNTIWTWVDFKTISSRMPLLKINSIGAFTRRLKKLQDAGFISTAREFHQRVYVALTEKFDELLIQMNSSGKAIDTNQQLSGRAIDTGQQSYSPVSTNDITIDDKTNDEGTIPPTPTKLPSGSSHKAGLQPEENPTPKTIANSAKSAVINYGVEWQEFFEHYKLESGSNNSLRPTDGRYDKFKTRRQAFSLEEMKQAVTNCFQDSFFSGNNDRGWRADIDYILRNDEKLEKLLYLKPRQGSSIIREG